MLTKKNRILAYFLAIILFVVAAILYFDADSKGFPDGHLTEVDRAEQPLFYVSSILSLLTGLFLMYLARSRNANRSRIFYQTLIFLFLAILIIGGIDWYFTETLDNGIGG